MKYVYTQFSIGPALGDDSKSEVRLSVSLGARPEGEWSGIETKLGAAAKASGWRQAGISHGLNVRKDPYFLRGGCSVSGCDYELTTAPVSEDVAGATDAQMVRTPELERFKAPGAPAQAPTDPPA